MKKLISLLLVVIMSIAPLGAFADKVIDEQLLELSQLGILVGDDTGALRLDDKITIAEAAKIMTSAMGVKDDYLHVCSANEKILAPTDHWAHYYIFIADTIGYIPQEMQSEFDPNAEVDGKTTLTMVMKLAGYDLTFEEISDYAKKYNLIDNDFSFNKSVTREEFAILLEKAFDTPVRMLESYDATLGAKYIIADEIDNRPFKTYRTHYVNELLTAVEGENWSYTINQMLFFKALINDIEMSNESAIERIKEIKDIETKYDYKFVVEDYEAFAKQLYSSIKNDETLMNYLSSIGCPSINNFEADTRELLKAIYVTRQ